MRYLILMIGMSLFFGCTSNQTTEQKTVKDDGEYKYPEIPEELNEFSLQKIEEIHYYFNVERWKNNGDIGQRGETDYNNAAKKLNIPVSKLKVADNFFHYTVLKSMHNWIKKHFDTIGYINPNYYNSIQVSPYTGLTTFYGSIIIKQQAQENINPEEVAKQIAIELTETLPEWISGYKLNKTIFKNLYLETEDDINIAFLWRRSSDIEVKEPNSAAYSGLKPIENQEWSTRNWNNLKPVEHPEYNTLKINN